MYDEINLDNVSEIIGKPNTVIITDLLKNTISKNFGHCKEVIDDLMMKGYYGLDILKMLFNVIKDYKMDEQQRFGFLGILGDTEVNLNQGADEYIQLLAMISKMSRL
jgi:DNA polymerase III gamma/tau subunit